MTGRLGPMRMGGRLRAAAIAATATVVLAGGVAFATGAVGPADSTVYHGCVKSGDDGGGNGQLRIVNGPEDCKKNERAISWNQKGVKGDPGATGGRGETGPQGPKGDQGIAGADGVDGTDGDPGPAGADGAAGPEGARGPTGLVWRGPWNAATAYATFDAVHWLGSAYIAIAPSSGVEPQSPAASGIWDLLAAGGSSGPPPATPTDADGDGSFTPADCDDHNSSINPGAPDRPDLGFIDSNCDGIDGDAAQSLFVAPNGIDAPGGGGKDDPLQTVQFAIDQSLGSQPILVASGSYAVGSGLLVRNQTLIAGGYSRTTWSRSGTAVTEIVGAPRAVLADGDGDVLIQLVTLRGNASIFDLSTYGLQAVNSSNVTLERVKVFAANARSGATPPAAINPAGPDGAPGGAGAAGGASPGSGGAAGPSGFGVSGGAGGRGGAPGEMGQAGGIGGQNAQPPAAGGAPAPDCGGSRGDNGRIGANGQSGASGASGNGGTLPSAPPSSSGWVGGRGLDGLIGARGSGGNGGGGGGGGTGSFCSAATGGGGGAGGGGGGGGLNGGGGGYGGGSFAIFVVQSTVHVLDVGSSLTAGDGGAGGGGGLGAPGRRGGVGGPGGPAGSSSGGDGGRGGDGGAGGQGGVGGGGTGGPSVGIFCIGTSDCHVAAFAPIVVGQGGAGGLGATPGGNGEAGFSSPIRVA